MEITFEQERETKRTIRYKETLHNGQHIEEDEEIIGSIYLRKSFAKGRTSVTITVPEAE